MARHSDVYKNPEWKKSRRVVIVRSNGLCEKCKFKGKVKAGKEVHHKVHLTEKNKHDWNIAYNPDNLIYLCSDCHGEVHNRVTTLRDFVEPV